MELERRKCQLWDLIGIHCVHPNQGIFVESFQSQTPLEQLLIDRELQLARQMLARDEAFDHPSDASLFLNVDKRLKLHRRREGSESGENLRMRRRVEGIGFGVDANRLVRRSWVD